MNYSIVYDRIDDRSLPPGCFYARIPTLDLTTHGEGIEGAKAAALDLLKLWVAEKTANGESLPVEHEGYFSKLEIADAVHGE
jgi:predicted RNase H-like HicB family nuclease